MLQNTSSTQISPPLLNDECRISEAGREQEMPEHTYEPEGRNPGCQLSQQHGGDHQADHEQRREHAQLEFTQSEIALSEFGRRFKLISGAN